MSHAEKAIKIKYLKLAQAGARMLWDEYYSIEGFNKLPLREQYKIVDKYHNKVGRLIEKFSQQGLAEIEKLKESGLVNMDNTVKAVFVVETEISEHFLDLVDISDKDKPLTEWNWDNLKYAYEIGAILSGKVLSVKKIEEE